jgi:hypothetical protein
MYANPALDLGKRTMAEQVWENVEAIIAASPVEPVASD